MATAAVVRTLLRPRAAALGLLSFLLSIKCAGALTFVASRPRWSSTPPTKVLQSTSEAFEFGAIHLEAVASAGLGETETQSILAAISSVCDQQGILLRTDSLLLTSAPADSFPGAIGRIVVLRIHGVPLDFDVDGDDEWLTLQLSISEHIDSLLFASSCQPVLVLFRKVDFEMDEIGDEGSVLFELSTLIEDEIQEYELRRPVKEVGGRNRASLEDKAVFVPSLHIEIDGADVQKVDSQGTNFDTSSVMVWDDLIGDTLRKQLLDVVLGKSLNEWDDVLNGPDPRRWRRGGLLDVPDGLDEESDAGFEDGACWGLTDEAVVDICYNDHAAIQEFETTLGILFKDFTVSRLPEAVLGASVSPLTANAPTAGDHFDYHIDADPYLTPPSIWADIYGRYPNRSIGKPRFVSCLLYLNDEWDEDKFGAPTRFLDPPTQQVYDVMPKPGRCVIMDQDISHTVRAPNDAAGQRPRYSLVWKLILHPKVAGQNVKDLTCGRKWPKPVLVGSAKRDDIAKQD